MTGSEAERENYNELAYYTLALGDEAFIHQYIVDAFAAQTADDTMKPIALTFALVGLYFHLKKGYSGKAVQRLHSLMAQKKREWPRFELPEDRGAVTAADVVAAAPGPERNAMIDAWCASVWGAYRGSHARVAGLAREWG
jgi:hypothetical protein